MATTLSPEHCPHDHWQNTSRMVGCERMLVCTDCGTLDEDW